MPIPERAGLSEVPNTRLVSPDIAAEAAVWVARLHGPDRSRAMERECLAWQARSDTHRLAFERCTDTWLDVGRVTLSDYVAAARRPAAPIGRARPIRWALALALALVVAAGLGVLQPWRRIDTYATAVGEQRLLVLKDGTKLSLNTATRVRVEIGSKQRYVALEDGEALFEVAKEAERPFVVEAGGSEVIALGTVFSVRVTSDVKRDSGMLAVTLVEGQVRVQAPRGRGTNSTSTEQPVQPLLMLPGDRVRLGGLAKSVSNRELTVNRDRPRIDQVLAWKRNEAVFDDVPLSEAVAEMNRYSRTPIVLVDGASASVRKARVSGLFRTGDNLAFAHAVAELHGLVARKKEGRLELSEQ